MRVIDLAVKDLMQLVRDWKTATFLIIMPVAFTLMFGFIFGNVGEGGEDSRLPVGIINEDGSGALTTRLLDLIDTSSVVRPVLLEEVDLEAATAMIEDEDLSGVVVIPSGYGEQVLAGEDVQLAVVADLSTNVGVTVEAGIRAAVIRLMGAVETALISAQAYESRAEFTDAAARDAFVEDVLDEAIAAWEDPPMAVEITNAQIVSEEEEIYSDNSFAHSSPGMMVQFSIAGLTGAAEILVVERKSRALKRLLTTAISRTGIILGHYLAMFCMIFAQLLILVIFGQIALGLNYLSAPLATLVLMVTMAMWTAALGLLIGVVAKTSEQAVIFSMIPMFVLSAMGGAWMPLETTPEAFQTVGHLLPTAWAIDGIKNILVRGQGLESALMPAGIMLAYAVIFFGVSAWRFRFEE